VGDAGVPGGPLGPSGGGAWCGGSPAATLLLAPLRALPLLRSPSWPLFAATGSIVLAGVAIATGHISPTCRLTTGRTRVIISVGAAT
jgi:hypothetical protein